MRRVITKASGFVRPNECTCILGPSGSGKTSLLNVLSGRISLSQGSKYDGKVIANGRPLTRDHFGQFAAFVQQDEVLLWTMTPREAFNFAQQIRTDKSQDLIDLRTDELLHTLGLMDCADVQIGLGLRKGEKKQVSIGYEIVTEPSLILLDEPTSGLDSISAYQIVSMLKREARRGVTVLATIHTPSAETFLLFDRCILLSEGHTIYNGSPHKIKDFFVEQGFRFKKYQNLADWLLKLAMDMKRLNPRASTTELARIQRFKYAEELIHAESIFDSFDANDFSFSTVKSERSTSNIRQFWLIFKRNMIYQ